MNVWAIYALQTGLVHIYYQGFYQKNFDFVLSPAFEFVLIATYAVLLFVLENIFGVFQVEFSKKSQIIDSYLPALLVGDFLFYGGICLLERGAGSIYPTIGLFAAHVVLTTAWILIFARIRRHIAWNHRTILIHDDSMDDLLGRILARPEDYRIDKIVRYDGNIESICAEIQAQNTVILYEIPTRVRDRLMALCYERDCCVYLTPKVPDVFLASAKVPHIFGSSLMLCRNEEISLDKKFAKRLIDIVCSIVGLVFASPFILIIAAAIKFSDGGPVLYKQKRLTKNRKAFEIYKFRSMRVDAEKDGIARLASENDERITPVGRIIRAVRFDELPQLINILRGDMSIVGPRPERPEIAEQYEKMMPEFSYRLKMKAGLTGLAQVVGRYNTSPKDKAILDLFYIKNYSFLLDVKLITMTVKTILSPEATQGIARGETTAIRTSLAGKAEAN